MQIAEIRIKNSNKLYDYFVNDVKVEENDLVYVAFDYDKKE